MRPLLLLLAAASIITSCKKNQARPVEVRVSCEKCEVTALGETATVYGSWTKTGTVDTDEQVQVHACRLPNDWITAANDTMVVDLPCGGQVIIPPHETVLTDTTNAPVSVWIFVDGGQLAEASGSAWHCESCIEESTTIED